MSRPPIVTVLRERGVRGLVSALFRRLQQTSTRPPQQHIHIDDVSRKNVGLDVFGYFTAEFGVGEAARTLVSALRTTDVDVSTINYTDTDSRTEHYFVTDDVSRHRTLLMSLNADQLVVARERLGDNFFEDRYVIGQWFWELEELPERYQRSFELVDEIWAPTLFIKEALEKKAPSDVKVVHMPLPLVTPEVDSFADRNSFGIGDGYTFLFTFDLMSVLKRKNALGLIDAYCAAFTENDGAVV